MKYIILIVLTTIICSCKQKSKPSPSDKFVVKKYSIALGTNIRTALFYNRHYYCLTGNKRFICLNNKFEFDSSLTNSINQQQFDYSYLSGDTLIAGVYIKDTGTKNFYLTSELKWELLTKNQRPEPFFEDDKFIVSTCCVGEFGGAVFFTDKKNNRVYSCPATCATIINRVDKAYFLTNTLAHMDGSTEIIRIDDPLKLYELTVDSLKNFCNWWTTLISDEVGSSYTSYKLAKSKFETGTKTILDTVGVLTMTSFVHNNQLYHINSDRSNRTFISKIQGDSLLLIDSIFNKSFWSYEPENTKYGTTYLHSFNNTETSGFLTVRNDTISIITFDNEKQKNNNR